MNAVTDSPHSRVFPLRFRVRRSACRRGWSGPAAARLLLLAAALCLQSACVHQQNRSLGWYAEEADLSDPQDGDTVASVSGRSGSLVLWSWDCWMIYPARAHRLIVSPGPLTVRVTCEVDGVTEALFAATLTFEAEPGAHYDAGSALSRCLVVRNVQSGVTVARSDACEPDAGDSDAPLRFVRPTPS